MDVQPGKYTLETFAQQYDLKRQSALNKLSKIKEQGLVSVSGGGSQKRIYTVLRVPREPTSGFYDLINKYSPEKLQPAFRHITRGTYTIEHAIIDGIKIGDTRTLKATQYLFRNVKNWQRLFDFAKKQGVTKLVLKLYNEARQNTLVKRMPKRYTHDQY